MDTSNFGFHGNIKHSFLTTMTHLTHHMSCHISHIHILYHISYHMSHHISYSLAAQPRLTDYYSLLSKTFDI